MDKYIVIADKLKQNGFDPVIADEAIDIFEKKGFDEALRALTTKHNIEEGKALQITQIIKKELMGINLSHIGIIASLLVIFLSLLTVSFNAFRVIPIFPAIFTIGCLLNLYLGFKLILKRNRLNAR